MYRVFSLAFALISGLVFADVNERVLRVCLIDTELYPLWRKPGEESLPQPGINIELQQHIARDIGHDIRWVRAPFARCLVLLKQNEVDMLNLASYNPDRERYGYYPKRDGQIDNTRYLKRDSYVAYKLRSSAVSWDGQQFSNTLDLPVAIEIGASIRSFLNEQNLPVWEVSRASQAFGMLRLGRVAAVVTNQFQSMSYESNDIEEIQPPIINKEYYLMISKAFYHQYPTYSERIWDSSKRQREQYYRALLMQYSISEKWQE